MKVKMNLLKLSHLSPLLLLAAGMGVFLSCAEDGLPNEGIGTGSNNAQTLTISVSDGGYAAADGAPQGSYVGASTRATEVDYQTKFTAGDKIGMYAVKNTAIVDGINNLCLTAADDGSGGIKWELPAGNTTSLPADATYYAYYPWRSPLTGDLVPGLTPSGTPATDAAAFFANVISAWTPATDQGTYAKYTAQDLMIAQGTVSGTSLSFSMEHRMALVVMKMPLTVYEFTNTDPAVPDYAIPAHQFGGFSPCLMDDYTFRYLITPASGSASKLSGSYVNDASQKVEWNFTPNNIPIGKYKTYTVDNAVIKKITDHQLQSGDYFMKDGSLVAKDATLNDAQKAACIGIVYWIGDVASANFGLLDDKFPKGTHGLVTSLWYAEDPDSGIKEMTWTYGGNEAVKDKLSTAGFTVPAEYDFHEIVKNQGYINTLALRQYNAYLESSSSTDSKRIKPIYALDKFETAYPAPTQSSGWYWPALTELSAVYSVKDMIDTQLGKVGSTEFFGSLKLVSSVEQAADVAYSFDYGNRYSVGVDKSVACPVRFILAF